MLGTGSINGGTELTITHVLYDHTCMPPLGASCVPDNPAALQFAGNFSTNCPVMVTVAASSPNQTDFQFNNLMIPANTPIPPGACHTFFVDTIGRLGS